MSSAGKPGGIRGPYVVLVTFSIVAAVATGILLFILYGPEPPEQPAPPEARMLPTVLYPAGDAAEPPSRP